MRKVAGDRIEPVIAERQQRGEPGEVLGLDRGHHLLDPVLDLRAEHHARGTDSDQAEEHASADGRTTVGIGHDLRVRPR